MPALPAAIAAYAAGTLTTAMVLSAVFQTALVVNGVMSARRAKKAARDAYASSLRDRAVVVRSAEVPRTVIYGRARVSGPLVYAKASGTYSENLHLVIALGGHELDAIEEVWFGDESIGTLDANGWVTGGRYFKTRSQAETKVGAVPGGGIITLDHTPDSVASVAVDTGTDNGYESVAFTVAGNQVTISAAYAGKWVNVTYYHTVSTSLVRVKRYLGVAAGERDTDLEAASGGEWTAAHIGRNVPRLHVTLVYDPDVFPSGIPNISAVVRGKKVYDPRTGLTVWSRNPAVCARDYLTDARIGFGVAAGDVDDTRIVTAANICDENVPGFEISAGIRQSTSIARYTCDGALSTDEDRLENMGIMLGSMVGTCVYSGGKWLIRAGAYSVPAAALDEDDLADGGIEVQASTQRRDLFNSVRGQFVDPSQIYQVVDFPAYESSAYKTADGGESLWRDIALPMTNNASRAQRIAKLVLHRARQALTFSATFKLSAYRLQPGDTFYMSSTFFGWSNKVFRVVDRRLTQPGQVQLVIQEEAAAVYDWSFDEDKTPDPAPNTTLPDPRDVPDIANLVASSGASIYRILADGTQQPLMRLTWDAVTDVSVTNGGRIEVYVKRASDAVAQPYAVLQGTDTGIDVAPVSRDETYNVMVRAVNGIGVRGAWAVVTHTVSSGAIVNSNGPVVKLLRLVATSQVFRVDKTGAVSPPAITLTAESQNDTSPIVWAVISGSATLTGSGTSRTLAYADMASDYVTIQVEQSGRTDFLTIVTVREGVDGSAVKVIFKRSAAQPSAPTPSAGVPSGWFEDVASVPAGSDPIWSSFGSRADSTSNWTWQTPIQVEGSDGEPGAAGARGSLTGYGSQYGISTSSWSDGYANRVISNMLTGATLTTVLATTSHLRIGDMVTLDNGSTWAQMRYWSGIGWVEPGVIIDGNLLVNGTISGDKIGANEVTADKIDSRNLDIKDASGNVIFSAGTNLNVARVAGLGGFATLSQITGANISTYMAAAAIKTAYIDDAQVTTLKIGGNAVTIPVSATGGSVALSSVYQAICSVGATLTGAALIILAQVSLDRLSSSTSRAIVQIRIRRSDTAVYVEREFDAPIGDPGASLPGRDSPTIILATTSLSGYAVYYIDARLSYGVNVTAASSALGLIEAKR